MAEDKKSFSGELNRDPIFNVIHNGIKRSIRVCLENKCYRAAMILIYAGIDAMAYLGLPADRDAVMGKDFINWVDLYISFPCKEQITGEELYGARCGMVHTYTPHSRRSKKEDMRIIGYMDKSKPEVRFDPGTSKSLVMLSIEGLSTAFFNGIDQFLIDLYSDKARGKLADQRLEDMVHILPFEAD